MKQKMIKFNVKNVKYAKKTADVYDAPADLAYASGLTIEADYNETKLYGDGQLIGILADDKGFTGTLTVTNIEEDYEMAMGRMMEAVGGKASIQQLKSTPHAIYYEVEALKDGQKLTIKNWMFGCVTGKPGESYEQTQDDPTINTYDYPLTVMGVNMQESGELNVDDYVDADGNTVKAFRLTSYPTDPDYATFGDAVPVPKAVA